MGFVGGKVFFFVLFSGQKGLIEFSLWFLGFLILFYWAIGKVLLCKCLTSVKYNLNYMYITFWTLSPYKLVFKGEFFSKFVLFGIRAKYHTITLSHGRGDL